MSTLEELDKKYKELFPGVAKKPVIAETSVTTDLDSEYQRLFKPETKRFTEPGYETVKTAAGFASVPIIEKPKEVLNISEPKKPTSWINYFPGELLKTTGGMLGYESGALTEYKELTKGQKWYEQVWGVAKETPASALQVGKEFVKAPFRVAATIVEPWINSAYGLEAIEEKPIKLPWLGEVPTMFYQYKKMRESGLSPLEAGIVSGSGTAMDLAISAGFAQYFISKFPVKVASGEFVPTVKSDGNLKMTFGKTLKDTKPIIKEARYYEIGPNKLLEVIPTTSKTIKVTGYNIAPSKFQYQLNQIGKVLKKFGITYTKSPPEIRSITIPKDILSLVEGKITATPPSPVGPASPIITPPPITKPIKPSDLIITKQTPEMVRPTMEPEVKPVSPKVEPILPEQFDVVRGFARKLIEKQITSDEFFKSINKALPQISDASLEDIADQARVFADEENVSIEKKVSNIADYIKEKSKEAKPKIIEETKIEKQVDEIVDIVLGRVPEAKPAEIKKEVEEIIKPVEEVKPTPEPQKALPEAIIAEKGIIPQVGIKVYRATDEVFDKTKITDFGISVAEKPTTAEIFGGKTRRIQELYLSPNAKIGEVPKSIKVDENFETNIAKYAKENGYDALRHTNLGVDEIRVFNPDVLTQAVKGVKEVSEIIKLTPRDEIIVDRLKKAGFTLKDIPKVISEAHRFESYEEFSRGAMMSAMSDYDRQAIIEGFGSARDFWHETTGVMRVKEVKPEKTELEKLDAEINKQVDKLRREMGIMTDKSMAGVRQYKSDTTQGEERIYSYFKLSRAKAEMNKMAVAGKKYATELLYENDPEFRKLVDKRDKLLEIKENASTEEIDVKTLFDNISKEEAQINETTKELSKVGEIEGKERETPPEIGGVKTEEKLEKIYQENKLKEEQKRQPPIGATIKITSEGSIKKPITPGMVSQLRVHFNNFKKRINELISPLYFHKNAPPELRNAIRTDVIGGLNKVYESRNKNQITLWGGLEQKDIVSSIEIIKLRDQVARIKADKGNPEITLKEAEESLARAEKEASPEALKSAETYRTLSKKYTQDLIDRGKLDPDELMEDYMRHYVVDYTPDWVFNKGIPARLRQPFRGYLKKAGKTTKEYRVDEDAILGQFLEVEHDNMIEDFIVNQSEKYDIKPKLSKEDLTKVLGVDKETGKTKSIKPGRIYIYNEKRYRGFNPAAPFGRVIFPTEEGLMALGRYKKTYLIPEEIYNTFRDFSERGSAPVFYLNRIVSYWKTMAILSRFTSFNINNMVGDTWMALLQSPAPHKVLSEIPTTINYLTNKNPSTYLKELDKFIKDNDIVDATYIQGELPRIRDSRNPLLYILQKSQSFSQFRESIMRIANASYLLKESKKGNTEKLIDYFSYMGLEGLSGEKALGKIARDILVDYRWTSKTFNRFIKGFAFPFGTWYFKGSRLIWNFIAKHWGKALLWLLGVPVIASLWNDRNEKTRELEGELPDYMQNRVHFILGENPDGTVKVLGLQLPQDALIGTKIFSIAVNQANLVAIGEKTAKEAAIYTIKEWGIQEAKGIAYLTNFFVRFIQGLIQRKDPYDKAPIYSMDPDKMGSAKKLKEQSLFFLKTMFPVISVYIKDFTLGKPIDITTKNYMDKLVGWGALGINDIGKRDKVYFEGKEVEWEDVDKLREIYGNELSILDKMEDRWIASDLYPEEFIKTEEYKKTLEEIRDMYAKYVPEFKDIPIEDIASGLGERLTNRLGNSTDSAKKWYQIKLERAKTDEEKKKLGEEYKKIRQQNMIDAINAMSKTSKSIFEIYLKNK